MIDLAKLADDISDRLDDYKSQIEGVVFRDDLPMLGAEFQAKAETVLAFVDDMKAQVDAMTVAVQGTVGVGIEATPADIIAEIALNAELYPALKFPADLQVQVDALLATVQANLGVGVQMTPADLVAEINLNPDLYPDLAVSVELGGQLRLDLASSLTDIAVDLAGGAINLGSLGGGFAMEGGVDLAADVNASLALLIDPDDGTVSLDLDAGAGFSMSVDGSLAPDGDLNLGFLTATADGEDLSDGYDLDFNVDLSTAGLTATLTGGAQFGRHITTNAPSAILPTISADFKTGFDFNVDLSVTTIEAGIDAFVGLYDIEVEMSEIAEFINGILGQIAEIANSFPLGDVVDILTAPIPVLDVIAPISLDLSGDNQINALDFILAFGGDNDESGFITAVQTVFDFLQVIDGIGGLAEVAELGNLELTAEATATLESGFNPSIFGDLTEIDLGDSAIAVALEDAFGFGVQADYSINIPLLTDPLGTIGALFFNGFGGEPVDLITWDLPPMGFTVRPEIPFNVGPLAFFIAGKFSAETDFGIGFDTGGFTAGAEYGIANGFYITTADGGRVEPFVTLSFGMEAGGGVGVGVARVAIVGGVTGILDLFLAGGGEKVRLSDLGGCLFDPISGRVVASLEVEVKVGIGPLSVTERISIGETILAQFNFDPCDPNINRDDYRFEDTGLARVLAAANALRLNVGDFGDLRDLPGRIDLHPSLEELTDPEIQALETLGVDTHATDEVFYVGRAPADDSGVVDPNALAVSSFGIFEVYENDEAFTEIRADGGDGHDRLTVAEDVDVAADFSGGKGSDSLTGGGVGDVLTGEGGNDTLVGNDGDDSLVGGAADDVMVGGEGADTLDGGAGIDEVDYSLSDEAVTFVRVNDILEGSGGTAEGDQLTGIELVKGSNFDDTLFADPTDQLGETGSALQGLDGDDTLFGGAGDDLLAGGAGADEMRGAGGLDAVSYAFSDAAVLIDRNSGLVWGGEATGDQLFSIEIFQLTWQGDSFFGGDANESVYGFNGDDWLDGGFGDDLVDASDGDDTVSGNADGDTLDGGNGRDLLDFQDFTEAMNISLQDGLAARVFVGIDTSDILEMAGTGNSTFEDVIGTDFDDVIEGDNQANLLQGREGDDAQTGLLGDDTLVGGAGADTLTGGGGYDLADYSASAGAVNVNLATFSGVDGDADGDVLVGIEALKGTLGGDTLTGNVLANEIDVGGFGGETDIVDGRAGEDRLILNWSDAEEGLDVFEGGGSDGFVAELGGGQATYVEFEDVEALSVTTGSGDDRVALDNPLFDVVGIGDDYVSTGAGSDTIDAGEGSDLVYAGSGDDHVTRVTGKDPETFLLDGGEGIDTLVLTLTTDTAGITLESFSATEENDGPRARIDGGGAIKGFEILSEITTGSGDDVLTQLGDVDTTFITGDGNDTVTLDYGDNEVRAGDGTDTLILDYSGDRDHSIQRLIAIGLPAPWSIGLNAPLTVGGNPVRIYTGSYYDFEILDVTGTENDDDLWGLSRGDVLDGRGGRDTLNGSAGDDTLVGGKGRDEVSGGTGDDVLAAGAAGSRDAVDTVTGGTGEDTFVLGDETGTHYGDLDQSVTLDYAQITDFSKADDVLQLAGEAADYEVDAVGGDTEIRLVETGELVAVVENVVAFRLDRSYVTFVEVTDPPAVSNGGNRSGEAMALMSSATARGEPFTIRNIGLLDPMISLLQGALDDVASSLSANQVSVAVDGDLGGVGFFENSPFGLEEGFVVSSGNALDIAGKNLADGSDAQGSVGGTDVPLVFEKIGATAGGSSVFRADLSGLVGGLASLTLTDSGNLEGAEALFSGFDLDGLFLSSDLLEAVGGIVDVSGAQVFDVFDFSPGGTDLDAGTMRNPGLFTALAGTVNGVIDQAFARLNLFDFDGNAANGGAVSLGDNGSVTFQLTELLETEGPLYLYVAEAFDNAEELSGSVTATAGDATSEADLSTDFGAAGTAGDRVVLSTEFTVDLDNGAQFDICDLFNIVIVTEEFPEFAGAALQDLIEVRVNGVNVAVLDDGRQATLQNLAGSSFGPFADELSMNLVGEGDLVNVMAADAYTSILRITAPIFDGVNTIEIIAADGADGLRDSAIFVSALTNETVRGGVGGDRLVGTSADDLVSGLLGSDTVLGGHGWDTYAYTLAQIAAREIIDERTGSGQDSIEFNASVQPGDLTFMRGGVGDNDLEIHVDGAGVIIVRGQYADDAVVPMVESIVFSNGSEIDLTEALTFTGTNLDDRAGTKLVGTVLGETILGLAGDDRLEGLDGDDMLSGGADEDTLFGGTGADTLSGGLGDDSINGGDGDDEISGGQGTNILTGGLGSDSFAFTTPFATTTITDFEAGAGGDVLIFDVPGSGGSFGSFIEFARQEGNDVVFDPGTPNSERLVLRNVDLLDLTPDNVSFI